MTADMAAIRASLDKATAGPWEWVGDIEEGDAVLVAGETEVLSGPWTNDNSECVMVSRADAELIVLLRNNAEALLDEIERLRGVEPH